MNDSPRLSHEALAPRCDHQVSVGMLVAMVKVVLDKNSASAPLSFGGSAVLGPAAQSQKDRKPQCGGEVGSERT